MPWSSSAKKQAALLIAVVVPGLMLGLGIGSYVISKALGLGSFAFVISMIFTTLGLALAVVLTLKVGKAYEAVGPKERH